MFANILKDEIQMLQNQKVDRIKKTIPPGVVTLNGHFCKDAIKYAFGAKDKCTCDCHEYTRVTETS